MTQLFKNFHRLPYWGNRPVLTVEKVLAWADAHHEATGRWPNTKSGALHGLAFPENWRALDGALRNGCRGLPGGQSLARLLEEHRGVRRQLSDAGVARATEAGRAIRAERRGGRTALSVELILAWADAYHAANGRWPDLKAGPIEGVVGETWSTVNSALTKGRRGLSAGWTLTTLLDEYRGEQRGKLTLEQIRAWAEEHRARTGRWPRSRTDVVAGVPGLTWCHINAALYRGNRGLPGGMTLAEVLGRPARRRPAGGWAKLSIPEILAWADAHHAATGKWPNTRSGPIQAAPRPETWHGIDTSLISGNRGLPAGQTLARVLQEQRGVQPFARPEATRARVERFRWVRAERSRNGGREALGVDQILAAADAHVEATGVWPHVRSGPIAGLPGETWSTINRALKLGLGGLPGGTGLADFLKEHRGRRGNGLIELSVEEILRWADAYQRAHGRWPDESSGQVAESPADTWYNINKVLRRGGRGLTAGSSLQRLLGEHRGVRYQRMEPDLSPAQILAWAEAHHAATGKWPASSSGAVMAAPEEKWQIIDYALRQGRRGLPGGSSLAQLMTEHLPAYRRTLTLDTILAWGEAHHAAHGRWPGAHSGAVLGAPGEKWTNLNQALRSGSRGLPSGLSLTKLFAGRPAPHSVSGRLNAG